MIQMIVTLWMKVTGAIIIRSVNGGGGAGGVVIDTNNAPASNAAQANNSK